MSRPLKNALLIALALCWLAAIAAGFWWFQARLVVTFDTSHRILNQYPLLTDYGQALSAALPGSQGDERTRVTLVLEPGCPCNLYSKGHLEALQVEHKATADFQEHSLKDLPATLQALIPATPFILIERGDGTLAYAGPVNSGVSCTADSSFLQTTLRRINDTGLNIPLLARGCYCTNTGLAVS